MPADSDPEGVVSYSKERSKAALASNRVESNVGNGVFDGSISSGISVQPSTTASQPSAFSSSKTQLKYCLDSSKKTPDTS